MQKKINNYMARSKWKLSFFSKQVWRSIFFFIYKNNNIRIDQESKNYFKDSFFYDVDKKFFFNKSSTIPLIFLQKRIKIFKNLNFINLFINRYRVGCKFGEFSFNRKPFFFIPKVKKKKNLKR